MEWYVLKSAACLLIFFAFYKFLLENISAHTFKRFYLLAGIIGSFLIPLATFTSYVEVANTVNNAAFTTVSVAEAIPAEENINHLPFVLWGIYGLGVVFFGFRFIRNLYNIWKKVHQNPILIQDNFFHVLLRNKVTPHTFFSFIFLNKTKYKANEIPEEVLLHEHAHAKQMHSVDILFIELLHVLFWFNPLFVFLKRSMKLNHEFLADRAVLKQGAETSVYQKLLLAYSSHAVTPQLAHSINYSSFKKRFTVMKTHTSKKAIWLRSLLLLPLVALMLYGFSNKQTVVKEIEQIETKEANIKKASKEQLAQFNKLAKKYNAIAIEDRKIPITDLEILEDIYRLMTTKQKEGAQPFPECYLENKIGRYDTYAKDFMEGAQKNGKNAFVIMISVNNVTLNGKPSGIKTFKDDLNAVTKGWNESDFNKALPSILISKNSENFLKKLEVEFQKTDYAQHKKGATLIIPPPPPPAPKVPKPPKKVIKGVNDGDANIPPPPPPPAPKVNGDEMAPPLPPESLNPLDHITLMAKRNAAFFYEKKRITAEKAIALVKKNKKLNIQTTNFEKSNPIVKISKKGIKVE